MAGLTLPDLGSLAGATDGVLGALGDIAAVLPADSASITAGVDGPTASLHASIAIDGSALTGQLTAALTALTDAVPGAVPGLDNLGIGLAQALGAIEPLKQALSTGGTPLDLKAFALDRAGDPVARIQEVLGGLTDVIPAEGLEALQTFVSTVTAFEAGLGGDPAQVATFLGRGFLGVPSDLLAPARGAIDAVFGALDGLAPPGQIAALPGLVAALVADLTALELQVRAIVPGNAASYDAALTAMAAFKTRLDAFASAVATIAAGVQTGIAGIDLGGLLAPVEAALAAVPELDVPDTNAFVELVIEPFRRVGELMDSVTPAQVTAQLRGWVDFIEREVANQGIAELEAIIRQPFEAIGDAIEGLQLEAIRDGFRAALAGVMSGLAPVTGAITTVREGIVEALDSVEPAVAALTSAVVEVQEAIEAIAGALEAAAGGVSLQGLHDDAIALIGELSGGVSDFVGTAATAVEGLHELVAELGEIDLEGAAAGVADAIGRITDTLAGIDVAPLPDALLDELRSALSDLLGSISLEPLQATLDGVLNAIPFGELEAFTDTFGDVLDELSGFSPGGLLDPLVGPFNDIVTRLGELHPGELLDPVIEQLDGVRTALDGFDPAKLLAPLDVPLQEVRAALESVAPGQLLAPLRAPFAELMGLVDLLDVTPFLDELDTLIGDWIGQGMSGLSGLGTPFEAAAPATSFVNAVSGTNPLGGDFGFHPGDVLKPVQDLYEKVTGLLDTLPAATIVAAFEQLRTGLVETLDALSPGGLPARLQGRVEAALDGFDVGPGADLLADLLPRYGALTLAVDAIDPAAVGAGARAKHAQLLTLTASVDPDAVLAPIRATLRSLRTTSLTLTGTLALDGIAAHYGSVAVRLRALLPDFLREPVTIEAIRAHLDAANPKHLAAAVNAEFDALMRKILRFAEIFTAEFPKIAAAFRGRMENALAGMLRRAFAAVYDPLRAQLSALDPAGLEADLEQEVYGPIRTALDSLSLAGIVGDSQALLKVAVAKAALGAVIDELAALKLAVGATYDSAVQNVVAVSPATLQADLQAAYAPIAAALAGLDLDGLADELQAQLERLGDQIGAALQAVLDALRAMVAAIPSGIEGVDVEISISARA